MQSTSKTFENGSEKVPLKIKIGWGMGGLADYFMFNALTVLMMPIYNIGLGLDAFLVGLAAGIPRILDAHPTSANIMNINCWNEWTEGSYLEPDTMHGMAYLEAVKEVFADPE